MIPARAVGADLDRPRVAPRTNAAVESGVIDWFILPAEKSAGLILVHQLDGRGADRKFVASRRSFIDRFFRRPSNDGGAVQTVSQLTRDLFLGRGPHAPWNDDAARKPAEIRYDVERFFEYAVQMSLVFWI